ncbi:porin [Variovorax sp. J22P271]|uniref:porin n=1 Tax=Variovorax davisae TaxID=3053515 RepID=UPI00257699F6|nr:porin [Variovorax sp. J22P271]MDM0032448.1 porin [Variovorax sp. J22P271]
MGAVTRTHEGTFKVSTTISMRKTALAFFSSLLLMSGANAQTSVTLFGITDATIRYVSNDYASMTSLTTSGMNSSRLGFRGTEDLGGGLQASFWLENGFGPDTGTLVDPSRFFNRRSTVSLSSGALGEIKLGRDITPSYIAFATVDPFGDNGIGGVSVLLSALGSGALTLTRADNLVTYSLPANLGGFFGQVGVAPAEGVVGAKYAGGMVGWRNEKLLVNASYAETTIVADKYEQAVLAASYDFGPAKVSAEAVQGKYKVSKQNYYLLGVTVPVGAGLLRASYTFSEMEGPAVRGQALANGDDASRIAVGYIYYLSTRTALYTTVARIQNKGASKISFSGGPALLVAGGTLRGIDLGLRHAF